MHAGVFSFAEETFYGVYEFGFCEVAGKCWAWVVGEDAEEHYGVVLEVGFGVVFEVELFAEDGSGRSGGGWGGFGGVDDGGEVEDFGAWVGGGGTPGGAECILGGGLAGWLE